MKKLVGIIVLAAMWMGSFSAQASRTVTAKYVGGTGDFTILKCDSAITPGSPGVGGVCFQVHPLEKTVSVSISDTSARRIAGHISVFSGSVSKIEQDFCTPTSIKLTGLNATRMDVYVSDVFSSFDCLNLSAATSGTITATFS